MAEKFSNTEKIEINSSLERTWDAIVNPEKIKKYLFGTETICDWKIGSPIIFKGEWNGTKYTDKGTILEIVPMKKLKYDYWSSFSEFEDKPENYQFITFELEDKDGKTLLSVTQASIPNETTKEHASATWKSVLNQLKQIAEEE